MKLTIEKVVISGEAATGPFSGTISFTPGLNVICADNAFGKSLIYSAIEWCLGLEILYVTTAGNNEIFSEAVRTLVNLEDRKDVEVLSSNAQLILSGGPNTKITLRRSIKGEESKIIEAEFRGIAPNMPDGVKVRYQVGSGSLTDKTGGFQAFLLELLGIPSFEVMTFKGKPSRIYLENLAPLFMIDQLNGWSSIQALQIKRYGQIEIEAASVETILGLSTYAKKRFQEQRANLSERNLKNQISEIVETLNKLLVTGFGWDKELSSRGSLEDLVSKYGNFDVTKHLEETVHWNFNREIEILSSRKKNLKERLSAGDIDADNTNHAAQITQRSFGVKASLFSFKDQLNTLRIQQNEERRLLKTVEDRIQSAKDLLRFKERNIGLLKDVHCPTCAQEIEPRTFNLNEHSRENIEIYIAAADKERLVLNQSIDELGVEAARIVSSIEMLETEARSLDSTMDLLNATTGRQREALVSLSSEIQEIESKIARTHRIKETVKEIQDRIALWKADVSGIAQEAIETAEHKEDKKTKAMFTDCLIKLLRAFKHEGVASNDDEKSITIDDDYVPYRKNRLLSSIGSASDHPRLILAYTLALMITSFERSGNHPGFVVFDEPLQQNPDQKHRKFFVNFLISQGKTLPGQTIFFTNLDSDELKQLRASGTPEQTFRRTNFLASTLSLKE